MHATCSIRIILTTFDYRFYKRPKSIHLLIITFIIQTKNKSERKLINKCCRVTRLWLTRADGHVASMLQLCIKVKWSRYRPGVAHRVGRGIAIFFHDRGTRRGWEVSSTPRPHFAPGKDPVGGPQGRSGRAENLVPTGIRSRAVQPVAQSLYRLSYPACAVMYSYQIVERNAERRIQSRVARPSLEAGRRILIIQTKRMWTDVIWLRTIKPILLGWKLTV